MCLSQDTVLSGLKVRSPYTQGDIIAVLVVVRFGSGLYDLELDISRLAKMLARLTCGFISINELLSCEWKCRLY